VEVQWYTTAGTTFAVLTTITIAESGRGSKIVYVPATAPVGTHLIRGTVIGVSRSASAYFTVTGPGIAAEPTATPSPPGTPTPPPTATPIPDASPVIEATPTPEPAIEEPAETPTPEPAVEQPTGTPEPPVVETPAAQPGDEAGTA
jgi:hypothetical protein